MNDFGKVYALSFRDMGEHFDLVDRGRTLAGGAPGSRTWPCTGFLLWAMSYSRDPGGTGSRTWPRVAHGQEACLQQSRGAGSRTWPRDDIDEKTDPCKVS